MARITVWRMTHSDYAETAFSGSGAERYGGRFNSIGRPVVYTSGSLALAILEMLVQVNSRKRLANHVCISADFDSALVDVAAELPRGWDSLPYSSASQAIGDGWLAEGRTAVLRVPSVVIPHEHNYLINPAHADFGQIEIGKPRPVPFDRRLIE